MATEFDTTEELHRVGLYIGTVVDNADPLGLGRVRFKVPGLVEPRSGWAFPLGTVGGGTKGRGFYDPPDVGADVAVLFYQGDVDQPFYLAAHWGKTAAGGGEAPAPPDAENVTGAERTKVKGYETDRFLFFFDHRSGSEKWFVRDKVTGDEVAVIASEGVSVKTARDVKVEAGGSAEINASGSVSVNGANVSLNGPGPPVARVGDAVQVTIPAGAVLVSTPLGPAPNPVPIVLPGTVLSGSPTVSSG